MLNKKNVLIGLFMTSMIASGVANAFLIPSIGNNIIGGGIIKPPPPPIIKPPIDVIIPSYDALQKSHPKVTSWRGEPTHLRVRSTDKNHLVTISYRIMNENTKQEEDISTFRTAYAGGSFTHVVPGDAKFLNVHITEPNSTNPVLFDKNYCTYNNQLRKINRDPNAGPTVPYESSYYSIPLTVQGRNVTVASIHPGFLDEGSFDSNTPCWTEKPPLPNANHGIY